MTDLNNTKLWAVNIPEEPDSELLHPVPSQKLVSSLYIVLRKKLYKPSLQ